MPLELFFGSDEIPMTSALANDGRSVCIGCDVQRDCLLDALLTGERNGIRGGFLGHERRQALASMKGSIAALMAAFDATARKRKERRR